MREQRIPQGGLRRPKSKRPVQTMGAVLTPCVSHDYARGTYSYWWTRQDIYCNAKQSGSKLVGVMDDYGDFHKLREEAEPWR